MAANVGTVSLNVTASGDLIAKLASLAEAADTLVADMANAVAEPGREAILEGARAARGSLTMSNNKKLSGELDALAIPRTEGGSTHAECQFVAVPMGAWWLAEFGGKPAAIDPARRYGGRQARRALKLADGRYFASVNHPGAGPSPGWVAGVASAQSTILDAAKAVADEVIGK